MAGMLIPGSVEHLAAQMCLPIGDKPPYAVISFTAQMVAEGLLGQGKDHVIIACNTASTAKSQACELVTDFILQQDSSDTPIFKPGTPRMNKLKALAAEIKELKSGSDKRAHYSLIEGNVHEVVGPTAKNAAEQALKALIGAEKKKSGTFSIVVDSTVATANSGQYPESIARTLDVEMKKQGFDRVNPQQSPKILAKSNVSTAEDMAEYQNTTIAFHAFEYAKGDERKTLVVQSRGHPSWVVNIEGTPLNENGVGKNLAIAAKKVTEHAAAEIEDAKIRSAVEDVPDLMMMCCTHYPAMEDYLKKEHEGTSFLKQDTIVKEMFIEITGESYVASTEGHRMQITRGEAEITQEAKDQATGVIRTVYPGSDKLLGLNSMGQERYSEYSAMHAQLHFNAEQKRNAEKAEQKRDGNVAEQKRDGNVAEQKRDGKDVPGHLLHQTAAGVHSLWSQDRAAEDRGKRTNVFFEGSIKISQPGKTEQRVISDEMSTFDKGEAVLENEQIARLNSLGNTAVKFGKIAQSKLANMGMNTTAIRITANKISNIARTVIQGETRGVDILSSRQEPGLEMFAAATEIASIIDENRKIDAGELEGPKKNVGIVTGFTVINSDGEKVGGENDGPPGAASMAKIMLDKGTPVTIICDKQNEASVLSGLKAAGLASFNPGLNVHANERILAHFEPVHGLTIQVAPHRADMTEDEKGNREPEIRAALTEKNTSLLISIERPGPAQDGSISSMIGADVSPYNADLSGLFTDPITGPDNKPVRTIGIGDGGNEIGMGRVNPETSHMRKPNYSPVVNAGDKIAAVASTDHAVMASVSNNGGVAIAISVNTILDNLPRPTTEVTTTARGIVDSYKATVDGMFNEGMSIDGVNKVNAKTVDGRTLHRGDAGPQRIGTAAATHDDMLDQLVRFASRQDLNASG